MITMQAQFAEAREKALKAVEEEISALYADGQEMVAFRFDAFSFWDGRCSGAKEVFSFLHEQELSTDNWLRAVWSLTKEQALRLASLIEEWNADWEYAISHDMQDYNAYHISFGPATGREHTIRAGAKGLDTAWQW